MRTPRPNKASESRKYEVHDQDRQRLKTNAYDHKPGMSHSHAEKLFRRFQRDLCYGEVVTSWAGVVS